MVGNNKMENLNNCPEKVILLLTGGDMTYGNNDQHGDLGAFEGLIGGSSAHLSEEDVDSLLSKLDPSMPHDPWIDVGMALNDWDPVHGLKKWEDWSKGGDNYTKGETAKRWKSFKPGGGITLGTVVHMAREADYYNNEQLVAEYITRIKCADEKSLRFDIAAKLAKETFDPLDQAKLVKALQDRYNELLGIRMPIADARKIVQPSNTVSGHFIEDNEKPEWCNPWVYVDSHRGFVNTDNLHFCTRDSFNLQNGKNVPSNSFGTKPLATKFVADNSFVETVAAMAYIPTFDGLLCEIDGKKVLNSFNPKTVPTEAEEYTEQGLAAIDLIKKHIRFICGNDEYAQILIQWFAHNVQYPGKKILWALYIQSIQGAGKSLFGNLLRACLGNNNIGVVAPNQVTSDFNEWANNVCVNILEELRIKGHNRHQSINALKPLITDPVIQINDKGVRPYNTYNTTNYICFTNDKDALPMERNDRRFWIIFAPIESLNDLPAMVGESVNTYFEKLFSAVRDYGPEIRKWLLEYDITDEFLSMKQAPMTEYKKSMITMEESNLEGLTEARELIKEGGNYYNEVCVSSADLFEAINLKHPELYISDSRHKNRILKELGFVLLRDGGIKVDGRTKKVWAKRPMSNSEVRMYLKGGAEYLLDI